MTTPSEVASCVEHRKLLEAAARCASAASRFPGDRGDHERARAMLAGLAEAIHAAAGVFALDPTLADERGSTRLRSIEALPVIVRPLVDVLGQACHPRGSVRHWPLPQRWEQAEALHARGLRIAESIPRLVPRRDHATAAGQQAISAERLAAHRGEIDRAADALRDAVAHALRTRCPDPRAIEIEAMAGRLDRIAAELDTVEIPDVLPRTRGD